MEPGSNRWTGGFVPLPVAAAWRHQVSRKGFEVARFRRSGEDTVIAGCTTAVEGGVSWAVTYQITVDGRWLTRCAEVTGGSGTHPAQVLLEHDGFGCWRVDGAPAPQLTGCLDVDLESSSLTNALPVHRFSWEFGTWCSAPAAYVRATDLRVERLEQEYALVSAQDGGSRFRYRAPEFDFACELSYDASGLVREYPGIAIRVA